MKIIDAHIHFYDHERFDYIAKLAGHENSEEHLRKVYGELGIRHAVVMGNRDPDEDQLRYPDFMSYCVGLDSFYFQGENKARAAEQVDRHLAKKNCVGVKLYPGYNPHYVSDPIFEPFYQLAEKHGKPVAIHMGATATRNALLKYSHPLTLDDVAATHPKVQFVMCHLGNPWIVDAAAVISKNKNVSADLSGILEGMVDMPRLLEENSGFLEHIRTWLAYVGDYSRFMYGTDWPLVNIPAYIDFISYLIPERHRDAVFFDNANRIYQLGL